MLNTVLLEGIVTKGRWHFGGVEFVRLACYADPGRPTKRANGIEEPDYVTLRCEGQYALAAGSLQEGDRVQAQGTLVSREYDIPLAAYAAKARGPEALLAAFRSQAPAWADLVMPHVLTELFVERLIVVERRTPRAAARSTSGAEHRRDRPAPPTVIPPIPAAPASATAPAGSAVPPA